MSWSVNFPDNVKLSDINFLVLPQTQISVFPLFLFSQILFLLVKYPYILPFNPCEFDTISCI